MLKNLEMNKNFLFMNFYQYFRELKTLLFSAFFRKTLEKKTVIFGLVKKHYNVIIANIRLWVFAEK